MAVIIIVVLVAENAVMRDANLMAFLVIMHGSEQAFAAISDFMTVFIVMVRIAEQCSPAMSKIIPAYFSNKKATRDYSADSSARTKHSKNIFCSLCCCAFSVILWLANTE